LPLEARDRLHGAFRDRWRRRRPRWLAARSRGRSAV